MRSTQVLHTSFMVFVVISLTLIMIYSMKTFENYHSTIRINRSLLNEELTVVTAYFNIGSFGKGSTDNKFTPALYRKWLQVFARIDNTVIGFFDNDEDLNLFRNLRQKLPSNLTVVHKLNRSSMWSFGLVPKIAGIFAKPDYPKHHPNTVVPEYSAAMHAKYEVMQMAIEENPFKTRYFCWLDIGLFRDIASNVNDSSFSLYLPPKFRNNSVAYQEVYPNRNTNATVRTIVYNNMVWLCGCFFIGDAAVIYKWTEEYKIAVRNMIEKHDLMSTDQQVIYTMFNTMSPSTTIQTYQADGRYDSWFHLGYIAKEAGLDRLRA